MHYSPVRHSSGRKLTPKGSSSAVTVRLACVRHAASVQSEPGSNSSVEKFFCCPKTAELSEALNKGASRARREAKHYIASPFAPLDGINQEANASTHTDCLTQAVHCCYGTTGGRTAAKGRRGILLEKTAPVKQALSLGAKPHWGFSEAPRLSDNAVPKPGTSGRAMPGDGSIPAAPRLALTCGYWPTGGEARRLAAAPAMLLEVHPELQQGLLGAVRLARRRAHRVPQFQHAKANVRGKPVAPAAQAAAGKV